MDAPSEQKELLTTNRKALTVNLDEAKYGTFAEIGAGQEVARVFFQAGGAAGTIAKSISAYDMTFSDAIYGKSPRYVSQDRLALMLDREYSLLTERLSAQRGEKTTFFVFADTVSARNFKGTNECHGWMGIRFQTEPGGPTSDAVVHVRMWDKENVLQQQALGIVGTNLIYGAFYYRDNPAKFIQSLADNLGSGRIEVDMVKFTGPAFNGVDNRLLSLHLVQYGLTNAVMFGTGGEVLQPSEILYKKAILVERGSFRPVTHVNVDMLNCACAQFVQEPLVKGKDVIVLMEITMNNLLMGGDLDAQDFLSRVDLLADIGFTVLISNYSEYYRLTSYFRRYTKEMIGVAMGINNLLEVFNEKYYDNLEGGILESFGRLFRNSVKLYIYPMQQAAYDRYIATTTGAAAPNSAGNHAFSNAVLINAKNLQVSDHLRNLYAHLLENHYIDCIVGYDLNILSIFSRDVLHRIKAGDLTWERMVPEPVVEAIKKRHLFGYGAQTQPAPAAAGTPVLAS
ncbi:nicotinate-nucleotide adenylyltransferase [Nibricoccus aquaticus]|uniref:Nicotinate-nucleotide adenylyltransferase n=1 Tax=Nibricoccus aquaticus TaxID=2576891 RepID=A0A290QEV7_9BACT|nr:nicotinate-nucleotide adenylyltransferase [Nibricoccus aquaticus]ATC65770.1 nicotinate-nucleotide adenylyltransferase [Nibricoccus aquaticus]